MRALRHISIQHKLTIIILVTSAAAMLVAAGIAFGYEMFRSRRVLTNDLAAQAEIIGANSAVALAFGDKRAAGEILRALEVRPEIAQAVIYKSDGTLFAQYRDPRSTTLYTPPPVSFVPEERFDGRTLLLFRPLKLGMDPVGVIVLRADLRAFRTLLLSYALIACVVVLGLLLFCFVLARPLQRIVSEPILSLAQVAQRVTAKQDYSLRARRHGDDEIGALTDGFNQMLEDIQSRDQELRRAYADLQSSEARFRQLAENITQVFWLTDCDKAEMLYVSPAYETVWGRSCGSLYRTPQTWVDAIHPEDRARVRRAALTKQSAGEYDEEYRIVLPDGSIRWIRDRGFPIYNDDGQVYRVGGIAEDITQRKRVEDALRVSERKYREFIEEATDGIFVLDDQGRFALVNPAGCAMLGYSEEEVLQLHLSDTYAPEEVALARERIADLHAGRSLQFERRLRRKDGSYLPVEVRTKRRVDGRLQAIIRDITERKRLEQELIDISERERGRIGQDIHDGLCQHLVSTAFSARALEKNLTAQGRPEARLIEQIAGLIDDAITQARGLARGLYPVGVESEGLAFALEELAANVSRHAAIRCRLDCPQPVYVPNPVVGAHLYRITQEAINNGLKHGQATEITINLAQTNRDVLLCIEDNGVGLPQHHIRNDGMGFRIMHYRARMIGGTLHIRARNGGGTQVSCLLRHAAESLGGIDDPGKN